MTLYNDCVVAGLQIDSHESDLYVRDTPEAREIIKRYKATFSTFKSNVDGKQWLDVPFMFLPFWEQKKFEASIR